jgi:DNA-binding IclR family transcriptional regulator
MSESIRAVERALDILMCFTSQTPELTMTQISELVGINKSTVHRVLATLEGKRFVERDPATGAYRPGIRLLQMAFLTLEHNDLRRLATPFLNGLCNQYHENVNLSVLDDIDVVYVDVIESSQRVKLAASPGQRLPAFCTASGKAILAFVPEENVKRILDSGMPRYTQNTILTKEAFFDNIRRARERGYAHSEQEFEEGINAIAAPIINSTGQPIASISIAGPAYRLTRERMLEIGPNLVSTARSISKEVERAANLT